MDGHEGHHGHAGVGQDLGGLVGRPGRRPHGALLSRPPCRRPDRTVTWDRSGAGRRAGGNPTAWAVVISIRGFVVDLWTPKAGRWWSRVLGDGRRQATAHQVGRGGRWPPGRRILGLGLVGGVAGGRWGIPPGGAGPAA